MGIPLSGHILDHNTADAESIGNLLGVLDLAVLLLVLLHDLVHVVADILERYVPGADLLYFAVADENLHLLKLGR